MIDYAYIIVVIFSNVLLTTVAFNCTVNLEPSGLNIQVWRSNNVILTRQATIRNWYFKNRLIAGSSPGTSYYTHNDTNFPGGTSFSAYFEDQSSYLTFTNANTSFDGNYYGTHIDDPVSANLTVHDVTITANFASDNKSGSCKAYLTIDESSIPSNIQISRTAISSDASFDNQTNDSKIRFPINDSNLITRNGSVSTNVTIIYSIINSGCNTAATVTKSAQIVVASTEQPNITLISYTSGSYNIKVHHQTNVSCARQVSYCLRINNGISDCNNDTSLTEYSRNFSADSNSVVILSVEYDVIYTKYRFDMNVSNYMSAGETTTSGNTSDQYAAWKIALIVIGAIIGITLLLALIALCCYRKRTKTKYKSKTSIRRDSSSTDYGVRKLVSSSVATPQLYPPKAYSIAPPEHTAQRQYRPSNQQNPKIRPTIPKPPEHSYSSSVHPTNDDFFPRSFDSPTNYAIPQQHRPIPSSQDLKF